MNRHFLFTFVAGFNLYEWVTMILDHSDSKGKAIYSQAQNIGVYVGYLMLAATKAHYSSNSKSSTLVPPMQETSCASSAARAPVDLLKICWSFVYG